ncbi:alpha/beta hydrolase [Amycolatopsis vastitatis]|uniref:Alpha/beta hydrolase n=1 Tax=Amycolatopsis vastitatis TaxID=1905142 RepID=A0A229T200_9PSEU|nr:alpha/beta hydrolase [Amycolatopsis vastitatis]OXM65297.1 alpha/beta hydrolase [Amycolatopsis vastitatis]
MLAALFTPTPAAAATTCEDLNVPVTVALLPQTMHGRLCAPPGASTVVVLIPGGTYNASYWDIGYTPEIRSFRLAANKAGVATLALDRLGTGGSSKPLSTLLSASVQATAAHQVIQAIHSRFAKVVVGGHSIGAAMAMIEAGRYRDVDGVLVTGMTHRMNLVSVIPTLAQMMPAPLDPALPGRDAGYLTTDPGTRYAAFHTPGPYDAAALAYDESTKDVFAATEAVDSLTLTTVVVPASRQITAPVLLVVGNDPNFCGTLGSDCSSPAALRASEAPFFGTANLQTYILNGYGHAINYAPNAPTYFGVVATWLKTLS